MLNNYFTKRKDEFITALNEPKLISSKRKLQTEIFDFLHAD